MLIKTLVENTAVADELGTEHGLSLHIETQGLNILFDVGASELFAHNAAKMGLDIGAVDFLVISHGHYDHGGGLRKFLQLNKKAPVYIQEKAFDKYYAARSDGKIVYVGLEEDIKENDQIVLTSTGLSLGKGIEIFANVAQLEPLPVANDSLFMEQEGQRVRDVFAHEQNLIITEGDKTLLIVGCAHSGVVNIIQHFYNMKGYMPHYVMGGFHLSSRSGFSEGYPQMEKISKYLLATGAKYYTGHCTGLQAYEHLKDLMGEHIDYLATGSVIKI